MTQAVAGRPGAIEVASVMDADVVAAAPEVEVESGLSVQEAARRLAQSGPNELRAVPRAPAWRPVLAQFQDPLIYLLLAAVAVAVAVVAWWVEGRTGQVRGWPVDAILIAAGALLNGIDRPCAGSEGVDRAIEHQVQAQCGVLRSADRNMQTGCDREALLPEIKRSVRIHSRVVRSARKIWRRTGVPFRDTARSLARPAWSACLPNMGVSVKIKLVKQCKA